MQFYYSYYTIYHNDTQIGVTHKKCLLDKKPTNETISISWDNLDEVYQNFGSLCGFNIWNFKKGRLVSFFGDKFFPTGDFKDIKEWKHPDLNISLKITYKEYNPSIHEVLQWYDGEKAIAYLRERGLSI